MRIKQRWLVASLLAGTVVSGCREAAEEAGVGMTEDPIADPGDGDGDGDTLVDAGERDQIEIAGTWHNVTLDLVETFSSTQITGDFETVEIADYDNERNVLVLRFEDPEDPSRSDYTKVVWLEPDAAGFYYCPIAFELSSVDEAFAAEDASDDSDLDGAGCDGGPWNRDVPLDEMVPD